MSENKIKIETSVEVIKRGEIEKRRDVERRTEINMLKVLIYRYRKHAKEFLEQTPQNLIDI